MGLEPLGAMYARAYEQHADRPALRDASGTLSYAELGSSVRRLGSALRAEGLSAGDRVMIVGNNSVQWAQTEQAAVTSGMVRVGVLTRLHASELAEIANDAEPSLLFADGSWLAANGTAWVPEGLRVVSMGQDTVAGTIGFGDLLASGVDEDARPPDHDDLAAILYTSGSTGKPKGVKLTHRNAGARIRNIKHELGGLDDRDVALHTAPISHFSGGIAEVVSSVGGLNVLEPAFSATAVADAAWSGEISVLPLVPTMITMLLEELERRGGPTGRVGKVSLLPYAGSAIHPDRAERAAAYFGDAMFQLYGASEAQMPIVALGPADHVATVNERGLPRFAAAGRPTEFVEVQIVDGDRAPAARGESGEIATRGPHVGPGYWRNDAATAENFHDGWCYTGDVGYLDENGLLFILDRRKDMIITGGFNVYPSEIERVVSRMPEVREVAVVGSPDEKWGEAITAVISLVDGAAIGSDVIVAYCRDQLGGYKVPKRVVLVDELPKRGTGKIDKPAIREQLWAGHGRRV